MANCPELPFLTGRRQRVTFTRTHSAHMQHVNLMVCETIRFTVHTQTSYTAQNEAAWPSGKRKQQCCGAQPPPQEKYCAQPESLGTVHWTTSWLHGASGCAPGGRYLQKTFGKYFKSLVPPWQHFHEQLMNRAYKTVFACTSMKSPFQSILSNPASIISHCSHPTSHSQQKLWSKAIKRFQPFLFGDGFLRNSFQGE